MKKILIVEDDEDIARIEADYLKSANYEYEIITDGQDAIDKFDSEKHQLIILDLNIPTVDGVQVCRRIRKSSQVPIIMVTARTGEENELIGLEVGADDYIIKPFSPKVLLARVKALLSRMGGINSSIINISNLIIDPDKLLVKKDDEILKLTKVQFDILYKLASNPGVVFSREQLIDMGYDNYDERDIIDRTIDSHIKNIRKILGVNTDGSEYIETVRSVGYRFTLKS
ncbi:MAG TPA: response regulator transcription factor [Candidatus Dojkabacteria bacterium]|nr:response regulator transcription factor [Candidatus Dojkabacteria bacterium]